MNSSACCVYVTSFYSTTSISFYKSFYTFCVFIYFLQLHFRFRGHFRVHFRTPTPTFICGRYTYTHLWMYSGLYSATATFSRQFSCTFPYIHAYFICGRTATFLFYTYTHLWMYSGLYSATATFSRQFCVYIYVHPRLHSSVDAQRHLYSIVPDVCRRLYSTPTFIWFYASAAHHLPCFQGGKECMATLHSSDRDFTLHYILHLHLENTFAIQASTNILHSTSTFTFKFLHNHPTFSEHFRDPGVYIRSLQL